jgi:succinate dehydrogenase flavin-adding protein (antitoxin of CptAB toxin-antitoxin module)
MKELDVLLETFIARQEDALAQGRWPELEALLEEEDDRIWQWVLAPETCSEFRGLIDAIVRRA